MQIILSGACGTYEAVSRVDTQRKVALKSLYEWSAHLTYDMNKHSPILRIQVEDSKESWGEQLSIVITE